MILSVGLEIERRESMRKGKLRAVRQEIWTKVNHKSRSILKKLGNFSSKKMMKKWNKFWRIFFNEVIKILKNLFHFWSIFFMKNCLTESKYWVALVNLSPKLLPDSSSFPFRIDFLNSFQTHGEYFLAWWGRL